MRHTFLLLTVAFMSLAGRPVQAGEPMSAFFRANGNQLVQTGAYRFQGGNEPRCIGLAPMLGGCTGRNGVVVWRSLPVALQARQPTGQPA